MKKCELCQSVARMYCESDQATLCWDCDSRVHSANFLVSKHSRILLCRSCQSLTPWSASGPRLAPTLSICQSCVNNTTSTSVLPHTNIQNDDQDEDEDEDEDEEDDDDDDSDNQVVPLTSNFPTGPRTASSSSSSKYSSSGGGGYSQGRQRHTNGLVSTRTAAFSHLTSNAGRNNAGRMKNG